MRTGYRDVTREDSLIVCENLGMDETMLITLGNSRIAVNRNISIRGWGS